MWKLRIDVFRESLQLSSFVTVYLSGFSKVLAAGFDIGGLLIFEIIRQL
jgi:hypothetical protein